MLKTNLDFLIYSPPKTGSSSLIKYLTLSNKISTHRERTEPSFFTKLDITEQDIANYNGCYQTDQTLKCEKSTSYFTTPIALQNIKKFCKEDIKFIVVLRDPAEVVVSYYKHFKSLGKILQKQEYIDKVITKSKEEGWFFDFDISPEDKELFINMPNFSDICHKYGSYYWIKEIGLYDKHLTRLFNLVDKNNIMIILYDTWKLDNVRVIHSILEFLDVQTDTRYDFKIVENSTADWKNNIEYCSIKFDPEEDIKHEDIEHLRNFYSESNLTIKTKFDINHSW